MAAVAVPAGLAFSGRQGWTWDVGALMVLAGVGMVAFVAAARVLKMPELGWTLRR